MALVVFLKGINVGGHRRFRPSEMVNALKHLDVVSIGAAGTFVVRRPATRTKLRAEIARRLPFDAHVMICEGRDVLRLVAADPFAGYRSAPDIIQFVSVLAKRPRAALAMPIVIPPGAEWCVRVTGQQGQFVFGVHRRQMKAIGQLGQLEKMVGAPATTRSWSTILTVAKILRQEH